MINGRKKKQLLQWHPAFYAGIQIEFAEERDILRFESEHQLGTKPKAVDVLIVKKDADAVIHNNIGRIFRTHNIVEYKSPGDHLGIDDYYKVLGYACFYKADTQNADDIKASDITVSFVCRNRPRKLERFLSGKRCLNLQKLENGIYYIKGELFPVQFICTSELSWDDNIWLKSLTNDLVQGEQIEKLLREYRKHQRNSLYKSVMNMVIRANWKIFEEEKDMCEALRELFGEELTTAIAAGIEEQLPIAVEAQVAEILPEIEQKVRQKVQQEVRQEMQQEVRQEMRQKVRQEMQQEVRQEMRQKVRQEMQQEVRQEVQQEVRQMVRQEGINVLIADNMEEGVPVDRILLKLNKRFGLKPSEAQGYINKFSVL